MAVSDGVGVLAASVVVGNEEGIEARTVEQYVRRVQNTETKCIAAFARRADGVIVRVVKGLVDRVWLSLRIRSWHVIRGLALNEPGEDILSVGELILVECLVFDSISI